MLAVQTAGYHMIRFLKRGKDAQDDAKVRETVAAIMSVLAAKVAGVERVVATVPPLQGRPRGRSQAPVLRGGPARTGRAPPDLPRPGGGGARMENSRSGSEKKSPGRARG